LTEMSKNSSKSKMADTAAHVGHILVTGGSGFIGSHTCIELLNNGYKVTIVDNFVNSTPESVLRVKEITGKTANDISCLKVDICNKDALEVVFASCGKIDAVIHFAGLKAVGESTQHPLMYFHNNITGTLILMELMEKYGCRSIVFSSSATVYGSAPIPYTEESPVGQGVTNPYGRTKFMIEEIMRDWFKSPKGGKWGIVLLRYFNPVGAHPSGRIGEDPNGIPNNLMPYIAQVCVGRREHLTIFGDDYDTEDGTGMRDYIHVVDLAEGHVKAIKLLEKGKVDEGALHTFNLGTGKPVSVKQLLTAMEGACGKKIPFKIGPRRAGDLPKFWAATTKAKEELGWEATRTAEDMCADTWRWQSNNPNGLARAEE